MSSRTLFTQACIAARIGPTLLLSLLAAHPARAQVAPADSVYLVTTTQALLDAITSGDSTVWASHLAPNWFISDEEGQHITRQAFLAELRPLPAGQQGKIAVANVHLGGSPGVAVVSYDADEEHLFHGQLLLTRFHSTDTYVRAGDRWMQIAAQITALPRAIEGQSVPRAILKDYVGTYQLTAEIQLSIAVSDSGLSIERPGRPAQPLHALDDRLFIRHGVRGFWVFERDSTGTVTELVNWRDNNPVVWRRH
jgi:hypothetical protein